MLFSFFDPISYQNVTTTDIFRNYRGYFNRVAAKFKIKTYYITGAPRPEKLAYDLYGNTQLYWILLMLNNNYDPFWGWIQNQEACYQGSIQRYKDIGGENQVVYHVDEKGEKYWNLTNYPEAPEIWYDKGDKNKLYVQFIGPLAAVDTLEASILDNEERRQIKIIDPNDMPQFISSFIREMEKA
ncbi:baseplate wedge subunit [Serratia phage 92A1]|nr:baseplate wedge subunit [Serratia phage 92A1]